MFSFAYRSLAGYSLREVFTFSERLLIELLMLSGEATVVEFIVSDTGSVGENSEWKHLRSDSRLLESRISPI